MRIILLSLFIMTSIAIATYGQDAKHAETKKTIVIDTDCGLDDLWAIAIMLSRPEIHIKAVIVSEGCLSPKEGSKKVSALLHKFGADSISVVLGNANASINPKWRTFCKQINWGDSVTVKAKTIDEFYKSDISTYSKYSLVCLGTLNTANTIRTKYPEGFKQIDRIVWFNNSVYPLSGFNYASDTTAAKEIIEKGKIRMDVVTNPYNTVLFENTLYKKAKNQQNSLAALIEYLYSQPAINKSLTHAGKKAADELVPLYILMPELFDVNLHIANIKLRWVEAFDTTLVKEMLEDIVTSRYTDEKNIVFNRFPSEKKMFNYDVRQIADAAIEKHGTEEWKACVITDEFHGHLGVFSIVGAKMGIKAREIFNVGPDQLSVLSFAGTRPPYSCLNDGIQVSTGATLGQGLIKVITDSVTRPSAIFSYKAHSVRITLKKEYLQIVENDIATGIAKFGLTDDGYWKLVRKAALNYWLNWSRNEIFEVEELHTP
jgi:pyrimidine-specific ribonucleoside hydrolase